MDHTPFTQEVFVSLHLAPLPPLEIKILRLRSILSIFANTSGPDVAITYHMCSLARSSADLQ